MIADFTINSLTDACRSELRAAGPRGLTPTELRDSLKRIAFPTDKYKSIVAAVHTILKRLESYKEVRRAIHDTHQGRDQSVYQWIGPNYGASRSLANLLGDVERDRQRSGHGPKRKGDDK